MITSIDMESTFKKIQHPFIKALKKARTERTYLNIVKATSEKLVASIIPNGKNWKEFF
jgi:hypothetical protein